MNRRKKLVNYLENDEEKGRVKWGKKIKELKLFIAVCRKDCRVEMEGKGKLIRSSITNRKCGKESSGEEVLTFWDAKARLDNILLKIKFMRARSGAYHVFIGGRCRTASSPLAAVLGGCWENPEAWSQPLINEFPNSAFLLLLARRTWHYFRTRNARRRRKIYRQRFRCPNFQIKLKCQRREFQQQR